MASWRFVACDLRSNLLLAELPLRNVNYREVLNGAGEFSADLPLHGSTSAGQPLAPLLAAASTPERTVVYLERNGAPIGGAIIWTRRRSRDGVAGLQGAGLWSFFRRQHLRRTIAFNQIDQLQIARDLVQAAEAVIGADIGVQVGTETSGVLRDRTFNAFEHKQIAEAVEQLAQVDNGFDFAVDVEPGFVKRFRVGWPRRGRIAGSTGLIFAAGKNLLDYDVVEDGTRSARVFTALGSGDGLDMRSSTVTRNDLVDAGWPLTSDLGSFKDVTVQATLDAHARAGVDARAVTPMFWSLRIDPDDPDGGAGTWIVGDDAVVEIGDDINFPRQADGSPGFRAVMRIVDASWRVSDGREELWITCAGR